MKWLRGLLASLALFTTSPLFAQDQNDAMADTIRQLRELASQMEGQLSAADIAEMRRSADEIERANLGGAFIGPVARDQTSWIVTHIEQVHEGRYEWLLREAACAGYQWENWRSYNISTGDRIAERNIKCKRAFSLFEEYFYLARDLAPGAYEKLAAFDEAAHVVVNFYVRR